MKRILDDLVSAEGAQLALLATPEGVLLGHAGAAGHDPDRLGALVSRFLSIARRGFARIGRGRPSRARLRGSEGELYVADLDEVFLAVLIRSEGPVTELEMMIEQSVEQLRRTTLPTTV